MQISCGIFSPCYTMDVPDPRRVLFYICQQPFNEFRIDSSREYCRFPLSTIFNLQYKIQWKYNKIWNFKIKLISAKLLAIVILEKSFEKFLSKIGSFFLELFSRSFITFNLLLNFRRGMQKASFLELYTVNSWAC